MNYLMPVCCNVKLTASHNLCTNIILELKIDLRDENDDKKFKKEAILF